MGIGRSVLCFICPVPYYLSDNSNDTMNYNKVISVADLILNGKTLALKYNGNFVGTEHVLLAALVYNNHFTAWLQQNGASKTQITTLQNTLEKIVKTTHTKNNVEYWCDYKLKK